MFLSIHSRTQVASATIGNLEHGSDHCHGSGDDTIEYEEVDLFREHLDFSKLSENEQVMEYWQSLFDEEEME